MNKLGQCWSRSPHRCTSHAWDANFTITSSSVVAVIHYTPETVNTLKALEIQTYGLGISATQSRRQAGALCSSSRPAHCEQKSKNHSKMIELKPFKEQAQKLRIAQKRREDLLRQTPYSPELERSLTDADEICKQMEEEFDQTLVLLDKQLRISPEQVSADQNLSNALEASIKGWQQELEMVQKEQVDQAITDAKADGKSQRYEMLTKREKELSEMIADAEAKLGRVNGRVANPAFANSVNNIVNQAKP